MKATIYHNPACGTSRKTLDILRAEGADVTIVEYLETPPGPDELRRLYARAGLSPGEGLRGKEEGAAGLAGAGDEAVLAAMAANPRLIERPLVETDKGVRLCRPQDRVREIL
ncbi:MAG: arsenate reductase (glutaredoxin) [Alphaproteobacteria bacterium]|nr:arsenate reductase (glutaredoxin) [Alphaproteobacteria bacterium]MBV9370383.1 arsenate reductase (glutaredoxin) [Alphaproteobacteria bacterium]MBV9901960.1 arsenate reductase (glutaredoxin) [Alphaproteobacteria bacterium]